MSDIDIGTPKIREKFDMLVVFGGAHAVNEPDHEFYNVPDCPACWMVRNFGRAIIMLDSLVTSCDGAGHTDPFIESVREFLSEADMQEANDG